MRKLLSILAILATVMLTPSCQKELPDAIKNIDVSQGGQTPASPEISLDMNNMEFSSESGSRAFNIKSNTSWTVSSDQTWCSVSPTSGKNSGSVTVKASENTQTSARTATVTVKSEIGILTVKVTQNEANAAISLDTSTMEFTSSSGEQTFKITANTSWSVSSDQTWCSVSPSSGSNNGSVTVKVSENTQTSARTATITVKTDAGTRTVSVTQNGASGQVSLSVSDMEFAAGSGSKIFSIKSNTAWAVSSDKNWCSVSPTLGSGDGSVTVSVDENTSISSRTATITVEGGNVVQTIVVTQAGDGYYGYQCSFLFDTQLHPKPCQLTSIIVNPGHFCKVEASLEKGIRHIKTTRNYDGATEDVLLSTDRENQYRCVLGANNCIIIGTSSYDNVLIAYEGQCSNCLEQYGGTSYPMSWQYGGTQLHCNKCDRTYDVNSGTVVSEGGGRRLYRYLASFDGLFIRVWN